MAEEIEKSIAMINENLEEIKESIAMITDYLETKFGYGIYEQTERLKEAKDEDIIFNILTHVSFKSYERAKRFYDQMIKLSSNSPVTLEDFFRYAKIEKPELYFKWGWYNISITTIYEDPDHDGEFLLFVPHPERLDR